MYFYVIVEAMVKAGRSDTGADGGLCRVGRKEDFWREFSLPRLYLLTCFGGRLGVSIQ